MIGYVPTGVSHVEVVTFGSNTGNTTFSNVANDGVLSDGTTHYVVNYNNAAGGGVFLTAPIAGMAIPGSTAFEFEGVASGQWFDPATAYGFDYSMTGGALFTSLTLPSGFSDPFDVPVSGVWIGEFLGGTTIDFGGSGASEFEVTGINHEVAPTDDSALPTYLTFNNSTATLNTRGSGATPDKRRPVGGGR